MSIIIGEFQNQPNCQSERTHFPQQPVNCYLAKGHPTVYFVQLCSSSGQVNIDPAIVSCEVRGVIRFLQTEGNSPV